MEFWLYDYFKNLIKNRILTSVVKYHDKNFQAKCILNTALENYVESYLLDSLRVELLTSTGKDVYVSNFENHESYDYVQNDLTNRLGLFESQYDIVNIDYRFTKLLNDLFWQRAVENMCFYLKPKGIMVITGDLSGSSTYTSNFKSRSVGVWRAILRRQGCLVVDYGDLDCENILNFNYNYLVVKKNG